MPESKDQAAKHYSSRFIVDVTIERDKVCLIDQSHVKHTILASNKEGIESFKLWLKNIFFNGVAGTLTVFSWRKQEADGEIATVIDQIMTTGRQQLV